MTGFNSAKCKLKGQLANHGGEVKIKGKVKTSHSRLLIDSPMGSEYILVQDATNWAVGDRIAITATGGEQFQWATFSGGDCVPPDNYYADDRAHGGNYCPYGNY